MPTTYKTFKETALRNNCPECFSNQGLVLSISQENVENAYIKKATLKRKPSIYCTSCDTPIYPARWTDDIDRIVDYWQERAIPPSVYNTLKPLSWILLAALALSIGLGIYLWLNPEIFNLS